MCGGFVVPVKHHQKIHLRQPAQAGNYRYGESVVSIHKDFKIKGCGGLFG